MKKYQKPQAQHWVVLRLVKKMYGTSRWHHRDSELSMLWLLREVGSKQVMNMIDQLHAEEGAKK